MSSNLSLPLGQLIQERLSIVMDFCFSRAALADFADRLQGEWKYLRKTLFVVSEKRANQAVLELALYLRHLVDREGEGHGSGASFGRLELPGNRTRTIKLRDVANKIIHASSLRWEFPGPDRPTLVCKPEDGQPWVRAEIDITRLAAFCGGIMH